MASVSEYMLLELLGASDDQLEQLDVVDQAVPTADAAEVLKKLSTKPSKQEQIKVMRAALIVAEKCASTERAAAERAVSKRAAQMRAASARTAETRAATESAAVERAYVERAAAELATAPRYNSSPHLHAAAHTCAGE